jgi:hypothetical protein
MMTLLGTIPQPPIGMHMPQVAQAVFTVGGGVPLVIAVAIAIRQIRAGEGPLLAFCLLGGAFACFFEPMVDVLGLVYIPQHGAIATFTFMGRQMPLFVPLEYPWYVGGLAYITCRRLERGIDRRGLFKLWGTFILVNYALEAPGLLTNVYTYYGKQPFNIWGHPLVWGTANALTALLAGALVYAVRPHLGRGWRLIGVAPLIFMADGFSNAGAGWPMYIALNDGTLSYLWTYLAGLVSAGLTTYMVWVISATVARPAPAVIADATGAPPVAPAQPAAPRVPAVTP